MPIPENEHFIENEKKKNMKYTQFLNIFLHTS